jgi:RNA polymerase sigma-70 factor (ECF subfamily)
VSYLPPYNESDLVYRLAHDDRQAFEILYQQYFLSVFRFANRFVNDRAAAEDITTESFVKLWNKRNDFDVNEKLKSFLFVATKNACLNYLRGEKRLAHNQQQLEAALALETENNFAQHPVTENVYQYLYEEIEKLPPKMKTILQLHLQGLSNDEISAQMNIAEKTVRNLKVEAIKLLRIAILKRDLSLLALVLYYFHERMR